MSYTKAILLKTGIKLDVIGDVPSEIDGYTIRVKKETAEPHQTFRVKPEDIAYIEDNICHQHCQSKRLKIVNTNYGTIKKFCSSCGYIYEERKKI